MTKPLLVRSTLIGAALRAARERAGLTQGDVAEKIGLSGSAFSRMEIGNAAVDVERFWTLAEIYGLRPSALLRACEETHKRAKVVTRAHRQEYPITSKQAVALIRLSRAKG